MNEPTRYIPRPSWMSKEADWPSMSQQNQNAAAYEQWRNSPDYAEWKRRMNELEKEQAPK